MKQVVSLVKDNQAHYALVDEEDGSIIPFADLLIPDPDRFGLVESALLGTNLIAALGLNGTKRPKYKVPRVGDALPSDEPPLAIEPPKPVVKVETARERRNRLAREAYHAKGGKEKQRPGRRPDTGKGGAARYISIDEVMAIVNQYPEGIRVAEVAERIWRTTGDGSEQPGWVYTSVSNRLTKARGDFKEKGTSLPFREEDRPIPDKDGTFNGMMGKYLLPA